MLEVGHLHKSFGGFRAITDVSFSVERRQIAAVIGPNGAGKSTLFNLITGHIPPDTGTVRLEARNIVGVLPQERMDAVARDAWRQLVTSLKV